MIDFSSICSIYVDAHDNAGRFVDRETGEIITEMSVHDFCLTDRWKPVVEQLRALIAQYGEKTAKARDDYKQTKLLLPAATLSGYFEPREVETEKVNKRTGEIFTVKEMVSRRTAHLAQHTGFLCIDIDHQDNMSLASMKIIIRTLQHRPEVALLMKSCSGTGYFGLIPLMYPQYHKEQFSALIREYQALGINLDRKCGDVTRIRFASYDDHPYINPNAIPYAGIDLGEQMIAPKAAVYANTESNDTQVQRVKRLLERLESCPSAWYLADDYDTWYKIGIAFASLPNGEGRALFHRFSALSKKYNASDCEKKYNYNATARTISIAYFFARCKEAGVTLY